ncbi:unnamed protein product, partial [Pylaiella littoralis]
TAGSHRRRSTQMAAGMGVAKVIADLDAVSAASAGRRSSLSTDETKLDHDGSKRKEMRHLHHQDSKRGVQTRVEASGPPAWRRRSVAAAVGSGERSKGRGMAALESVG